MKKCRVWYAVIPLVTLGIAFLGQHFTGKWMDWYSTLNLPARTPSGQVIGIIWTIIFVLFAVSAIIFCIRSDHDKKFWLTSSLFIDNAILNILWSRLFFVKHLFVWSIVEMILLLAVTVMLIVATRTRSKWSAILLIPYALWLIVATVLAFQVMLLN